MIILGINAFHDDSLVALVRDGKLTAAAEEQRFRRVKHLVGYVAAYLAAHLVIWLRFFAILSAVPSSRQMAGPRL
jgi:hypothetical protein